MGSAIERQNTLGSGRHRTYNLGGDLNIKSLTVTMSSSYATGGDTFSLRKYFQSAVFGAIATPASGYVFEVDVANEKIKAYYGNYEATSDGPLKEVAESTDLGDVTTQVLAWGR